MHSSKQLLAIVALATYVSAQSGAPLYGQCGGKGWSGATTCATGVCTFSNDYYSQCLPGSATTTTKSSTTTSSPSSTTTSSSSTITSSSSSTTTSSSSTSSTSTSSTSGPTATGFPIGLSPEWTAAWTKAKAAVAKLSLADKVAVTTGTGWQKGACVGNTPAVSSINYPSLCLQDAPVGVRFADKVSMFPAGINAAATFNRTLIYNRGVALGQEFKGKGIHVALGPMMNIARNPAGGRNWEGFGGDPFLSGEGAFETIRGMQSTGVQANAKHYINNEQEHFRTSSTSNVDDRTQHEVYFHPFLRSIQANVASVMCSYNRINGTYACENDKLLNGMLKTETGWGGYVMSDWAATMSGVPSVNGGLDMTMPGDITFGSGTTYFGQNLINAVNQGQVKQSRIDEMATRILAGWYLLKQDSGYPATNFDSWNAGKGSHVDVQGNHASVIREMGSSSTVLLKNKNGALPLNKPKSLALIGSAASVNPSGANACTDRGCNVGTLAMGWGSGTTEFPYLISPSVAISAQARLDGTTVTTTTSDTDASAAAGKSVAIVFITADSGEEYITVEGNMGDRNSLDAWHGGASLVQKVASANANTIVVVQSVGAIIMEAFADHPNVTAIVWSGLAGQEAGNSLVDILYGAVNPSGRLPYTIGKSASDYPAQLVTSGGSQPVISYTEGLLVDYRWFDAKNIAPRYEFGFGLSYTTFDYAKVAVSGSVGSYTPPSGPGATTNSALHANAFTVSFTLTNNGTRAGHEIPQLYISPPASAKSAPYLLKGFDSVYLTPGQSKTVSFPLSRYDLSFWNVVTQRWEIPSGTHGVTVGASSRDRRLTSSIVV